MGNICFCGKEKREDRLACPRCFELYRKATRGTIDLLQWVKKQALNKLEGLGASQERPETNLEIDLKAKRDDVRILEDMVSEEVPVVLNKRLAGAGQLRQEEVEALREDIRKELWKEKGGNRLYAEYKNLQREIQEKITPLRDLLREIEKIEKEHNSVDRLIDSVLKPKT